MGAVCGMHVGVDEYIGLVQPKDTTGKIWALIGIQYVGIKMGPG
jgi:hypothetical protein